jgi:hypothetical protein
VVEEEEDKIFISALLITKSIANLKTTENTEKTIHPTWIFQFLSNFL